MAEQDYRKIKKLIWTLRMNSKITCTSFSHQINSFYIHLSLSLSLSLSLIRWRYIQVFDEHSRAPCLSMIYTDPPSLWVSLEENSQKMSIALLTTILNETPFFTVDVVRFSVIGTTWRSAKKKNTNKTTSQHIILNTCYVGLWTFCLDVVTYVI